MICLRRGCAGAPRAARRRRARDDADRPRVPARRGHRRRHAQSERAVREGGAVPATVGVLGRRDPRRADRRRSSSASMRPHASSARATSQSPSCSASLERPRSAERSPSARPWGSASWRPAGLGGVHRGWPTPPDVSADLQALAETQALVVSSGVKSLLDVPATSELLETLGVPVLGWRTDSLPLFYAARGGPPVSARVESAAEAAAIAHGHWELGRGGVLLGRPPDRQPRRRRASDRGGAGRSCRGRRARAGGDAVRPVVPAPRERRPHAGGEPRADRRQCPPRRRDRRRLIRAARLRSPARACRRHTGGRHRAGP